MTTARQAALEWAHDKFKAAMEEATLQYAQKLYEAGLSQDAIIAAAKSYFDNSLMPWYFESIEKIRATLDLACRRSPSAGVH